MRTVPLWGAVLTILVGCNDPKPSPVDDVAPQESPRPAQKVPTVLNFAPCSAGMPETSKWKCNPVFADVNGDGNLDLGGHPRLGKGPRVWLGSGGGEWTEASAGLEMPKGSSGGGLAFADVNGDGKVDVAVGDHHHGIFVFLGDGTGNWELVTDGLTPGTATSGAATLELHGGAESVAIGDVNGDGHADLVAASSQEGGLNVYLGDGSGRSWRRASEGLAEEAWAPRLVLADMNGDDLPDIVAACAVGPRVWLNGGDESWTSSSENLPTPRIQGIYHGIAVGDVNGDGLADLATANWVDGPEAYLQQPDGSWQKTPDVFPDMFGGAIGLAMGDLDRDGNLDIVVSGRLRLEGGYVRGVFPLLGDGQGQWTYIANSNLPETGLATTMGVALGDVNGDGLLDVAAASGLTVETVPGPPNKPAYPWHLLVWCAQPIAE
ncbi:MAG: VCBS repeat-containing protein [bacterium]|nr:VCBS repeat-containing protein [bacterium]